MFKKIWQTILLVLLVAILCFLAFSYGYYRICALNNQELAGFDGVNGVFFAVKNMNIRVLLLACVGVSSFLVFCANRLLKYMSEVRYLHSPLSKIDKMSGEEFEYYLKLRLEKLGFKVEMTPASNDYGADLFCFDKDETIVVQVKRYEANVGTKAVQEVVAAREYYEADGCVVITNSHFTINALNLAEANEVALIDRDDLMNFGREKLYYNPG